MVVKWHYTANIKANIFSSYNGLMPGVTKPLRDIVWYMLIVIRANETYQSSVYAQIFWAQIDEDLLKSMFYHDFTLG